MKDYIITINNFIKKSLAREISREEDQDKMNEFITFLNELMANYSAREDFICIEFEQKKDAIYIIRCSFSFCALKEECEGSICRLDDFIAANGDTWDFILKKMSEKIEELRPGFLKDKTVLDYISRFLGGDDDFFDLMILKEHVILNEEIETSDIEPILNAYLGSIKEIIAERIEDAVKKTLLDTILHSSNNPSDAVIKELWRSFRKNESISQQEVDSYVKEHPRNLLRSRDETGEDKKRAEEKEVSPEEKVPVTPEKLAAFIKMYDITERETEIINRILLGKKTKEIAYELFISPGTTRNHIQNIFSKTETHSRIELCSLIMKTGPS